MKTGLFCILVGACGIGVASASVTITSYDMFHEVGQWYRVYANDADVDVSGRLGTTGPGQIWDFTSGPQDKVYRFDYLPVSAGDGGAYFPQARLAERMTDESDGTTKYLYLDQVVGVGRRNFGFYDPTPVAMDTPEGVFQSSIVDFPESIRYGDTWSVRTEFYTTISGVPSKFIYAATATADASGVVSLPRLGFDECLRVNELAEYNILIDFEGEGNYQAAGSYLIRTLYWLRKNHGIVVQITSKHSWPTPPSDTFPLAEQFIRQFELNHPKGSLGPQPVKALPLARGSGQSSARWLLTWEKGFNTGSYRVEWSDNPGNAESWTALETTTQTSLLLNHEAGPGGRFYRIVSIE